MRRLYLDCDGVLADFDSHFEELFGMNSQYYEDTHGAKALWTSIIGSGEFFYDLPLMQDAMELVSELKAYRPIILTGVPVGSWAVLQKLKWKEKYFPDIPMITCRSKEKRKYCLPGDIIVDDLLKYKHLWEEAGGHFVLHTDARSSIAEVKALWPL